MRRQRCLQSILRVRRVGPVINSGFSCQQASGARCERVLCDVHDSAGTSQILSRVVVIVSNMIAIPHADDHVCPRTVRFANFRRHDGTPKEKIIRQLRAAFAVPTLICLTEIQ